MDYEQLLRNFRSELRKVVLELDPDKTYSRNEINRMHTKALGNAKRRTVEETPSANADE